MNSAIPSLLRDEVCCSWVGKPDLHSSFVERCIDGVSEYRRAPLGGPGFGQRGQHQRPVAGILQRGGLTERFIEQRGLPGACVLQERCAPPALRSHSGDHVERVGRIVRVRHEPGHDCLHALACLREVVPFDVPDLRERGVHEPGTQQSGRAVDDESRADATLVRVGFGFDPVDDVSEARRVAVLGEQRQQVTPEARVAQAIAAREHLVVNSLAAARIETRHGDGAIARSAVVLPLLAERVLRRGERGQRFVQQRRRQQIDERLERPRQPLGVRDCSRRHDGAPQELRSQRLFGAPGERRQRDLGQAACILDRINDGERLRQQGVFQVRREQRQGAGANVVVVMGCQVEQRALSVRTGVLRQRGGGEQELVAIADASDRGFHRGQGGGIDRGCKPFCDHRTIGAVLKRSDEVEQARQRRGRDGAGEARQRGSAVGRTASPYGIERFTDEHIAFGRLDELRERLVAAVGALKSGDPKDEDTFIGPMIDAGEAERLAGWIDEAVGGGARVLTGGQRDGAMLAATLLDKVPDDAKLYREEAFGPVALLEPFDDFTQALARVNDSRYGLQAGLFTDSLAHTMQAWDELEVGGVIVGEVPSWRVDNMPYGGVKDSGLGREGVRYAIRDMTETRLLVLRDRS